MACAWHVQVLRLRLQRPPPPLEPWASPSSSAAAAAPPSSAKAHKGGRFLPFTMSLPPGSDGYGDDAPPTKRPAWFRARARWYTAQIESNASSPLSLLPVKQLTSKALGKEIELHLLDCEDVRGPVARIIVCCGGGVILGAYELADYMSGVRANRICDDVFARLLGAFGRLPSVVEKKPVVLDGNRFAGSRVFPSTLNPDDVISVNPFA